MTHLTDTTELWIQHEDFSVFGTIVEVYHLIDTLCWPNSGSTPVIWARTDTGWTMVFDGSEDWPTTALFRLVIEEIQIREDAARDAYFEATGADEGLQPDEISFEDVVDCNSFNPSHPEGDEPSPEEFDAWDAHLAAGGFSN